MRGALKSFQLLWSLGVPDYYQVWAFLNVVNLCVMYVNSYLSDNNIHNEILMGDRTLAWRSMSDQH